jgi:hypothetical protein
MRWTGGLLYSELPRWALKGERRLRNDRGRSPSASACREKPWNCCAESRSTWQTWQEHLREGVEPRRTGRLCSEFCVAIAFLFLSLCAGVDWDGMVRTHANN